MRSRGHDEFERRQITGRNQHRVRFRSALAQSHTEVQALAVREALRHRRAILESLDPDPCHGYDFEIGLLDETLQMQTDLIGVNGSYSHAAGVYHFESFDDRGARG